MMKAIVQDRYGCADVLRLREIEPPVPGPGRVLVEVHAAGVDPGVWHLMTGRPYLVRLGSGLGRPRRAVLGMDLAGTVAAVGSGATGFAIGDAVYGVGSGTFAEFAVARPDQLAPKPDRLSFAEAAAVPVSATTALQGLRDVAHVQAGDRVLVLGAGGGVGSYAVQIATAYGASVTGVCGPGKLDLVRSLGAEKVIDYTSTDPLTSKYQTIVDTAGNRPLRTLRPALTRKGTLVLVGGEGGRGALFGGFQRQLGAPVVSLVTGARLRTLLALVRRRDLDELRELIDQGNVRPVIDRRYPLAEAADAIRHLEQGHATGKMVVTVRE
jgi:NADPH:quinone reductase-like Zn-dependent oxidoreductase